MTVERIKALENKLLERKAALAAPPQELLEKMTKAEIRRLQREVKKRAKDLYPRIGLLREVLTKNFEGRLELGTSPEGIDPEQIHWDQMPEKIAACFQPEFKFQPEDITGFSVSVDESSAGGTRKIVFNLYRTNYWWSFADFGVTARSNYHGGGCSIICTAKQGQVREAREAGIALRKHIRGNEPTGKEGQLKSSIRSLDLLEALSGFVVGEMERQIKQPSE